MDCSFPELQELELWTCADAAATQSHLLRANADHHRQGERCRFPRLERLVVASVDASQRVPFGDVLAPVVVDAASRGVAPLPALRHLVLDDVECAGPVTGAHFASFASHFPALQSLSLPRAPLTVRMVEGLIDAVPTLTTIANERNPDSSLTWPGKFAHRVKFII